VVASSDERLAPRDHRRRSAERRRPRRPPDRPGRPGSSTNTCSSAPLSTLPSATNKIALAAYANYYVDTAAAIADIGAGESAADVREIVVGHRDRVIFGTDLLRTRTIEMPDLGRRRWSLREYFERHWRFDLPDDVLKRLYVENARAVFRLPALSA
jgi:amidohydrolase family protein